MARYFVLLVVLAVLATTIAVLLDPLWQAEEPLPAHAAPAGADAPLPQPVPPSAAIAAPPPVPAPPEVTPEGDPTQVPPSAAPGPSPSNALPDPVVSGEGEAVAPAGEAPIVSAGQAPTVPEEEAPVVSAGEAPVVPAEDEAAVPAEPPVVADEAPLEAEPPAPEPESSPAASGAAGSGSEAVAPQEPGPEDGADRVEEPATAPPAVPDLSREPQEPASLPESPLQDDLTALVARAPDGGCVVVRRDGAPVFARNADEALVPASLQKLVLAVAALEILGPDYRFRTTAVAQSPPVGGVLAGDLYIVGGGDPLLSTPDFMEVLARHGAVGTPLAELAGDLVAAGLTRIEGSVVAVEDRYDAFANVPEWPARYETQSLAGAFNAVAVNQGWRTSPGIVSTWGLLPHPTPALRTATVFDDLLEARSVWIPGSPRVAARGGDYSGFIELASLESAPLGDQLHFLLGESDNTLAEMLMKEMGVVTTGVGTTRAGALAVHGALAGRLPLLPVPADGSGLSPSNRLSCAQVVEVLDIGGPGGSVGSGLAVAGHSGTVENRYRGSSVAGLVRAKTGSLDGVAALAGFATAADGGSFTFAVILNSSSGLVNADLAHGFFADLLEILVAHTGDA